MQPSWKLRLWTGLSLILAVVLLTGPVDAGIKYRSLQKVELTGQALDITVSPDGKLVFTLTPGKILVYSAVEDAVIDRITIDKNYTRIAYANENRLILSAADPASLEIIRYDQVYDINIVNRPFTGPRDAKVTLVVFDDYQ